MLTLRRGQKKAMEATLLARFVGDVAMEVRASNVGGARALAEDAVRERVRVAVEEARALGVETRDGLRLFALMSFDIAPDFHLGPGVQQILRAKNLDERGRFGALSEHLYGPSGEAGGLV